MRRPLGIVQSRPTVRKARTAEETDWSEWEMMMEMMLAENMADAPPDRPVSEPRGPEQPRRLRRQPAGGGYGGAFVGGPPVPDKETDSEDSNIPARGYGGYYGGGYGGSYRAEEPEDPNSPDANSPENRP